MWDHQHTKPSSNLLVCKNHEETNEGHDQTAQFCAVCSCPSLSSIYHALKAPIFHVKAQIDSEK